MSKRESRRLQELGPKKYYSEVERHNKFYDNHMAGKTNPKTGDYYHAINFKDPNKKKGLGSRYFTTVPCEQCGTPLSLTTKTAAIICASCNKFHSVTINQEHSIVLVNDIEFIVED